MKTDRIDRLGKDKYFLAIRDIIRQTYGFKAHIVLFGSRAAERETAYSDYDIAIISELDDRMKKLFTVKEKLEESNIPFKVDVLDYYSTSNLLRKEIDRGIIWID
ncbi:MAG: hypothetical protein CVV44_07880 [Spirochaetae bacterium HGW-Spirochaetae-1]|jgi:hypothetical protein|nr:MAG: hypothetical protein CVV44_07880 [Spirochaetae bacterium HGW-Spirochaetae-1]